MTAGAVLIASRLGDRRQDLREESPDSIVWSSVVTGLLHEHLMGHAATLAGDRTPRYRRLQLDGTKSLPIEDLVYMAIEAPDKVVPALEALLLICGRTSVPLSCSGASVCEANSGVLRSFGEFEATLSEALEDQVIDAHEAVDLLARISAFQNRLFELTSAIVSEEG